MKFVSTMHEITERQDGRYYMGFLEDFMIMVDCKAVRSNTTGKPSKACQIDRD